MKLICLMQHREMLEEKLKPFEHLDLILIEINSQYNGVGIQFDQDDIEELIQFLQLHFIQQQKKSLIGKKAGRTWLVNLNDILYIEGFQHDTYAYTKKDCYQLNHRLYQLQEQLYPQQFVRISKSYLVNVMKVKAIETGFHGRLILMLENSVILEVSRSYARNFKQIIGME